jgi:hypothetical protein
MHRALLASVTAAISLFGFHGDAASQNRFPGASARGAFGRMQLGSGVSRPYQVVPRIQAPQARFGPVGEQRSAGLPIAAPVGSFAWHRVGLVGQTSSLGVSQSSVIPAAGLNRAASNPHIGMSERIGGDHSMRWQRVGSGWRLASALGNHVRLGTADPFFFRRKLWVNGALELSPWALYWGLPSSDYEDPETTGSYCETLLTVCDLPGPSYVGLDCSCPSSEGDIGGVVVP